jgi:hypothetical protein
MAVVVEEEDAQRMSLNSPEAMERTNLWAGMRTGS